jgi:hypothetical protein
MTINAQTWRCFHCDAVFTDTKNAELHFGRSEFDTPACHIDIAEYRRMQELCRRYAEEDTDWHRALHAKDAQMLAAIRRAEEEGYAKGLRDAKL